MTGKKNISFSPLNFNYITIILFTATNRQYKQIKDQTFEQKKNIFRIF